MASKMEEILEQLQQINEDLNNSVKEVNVKWRMVDGERVKKGDLAFDNATIASSKNLLEDIIEKDINGGSLKTESDLNSVKEKIDEVMETLKQISSNKLVSEKRIELMIKPIIEDVVPVQGELTRKHDAIQEYKTKGYDANEHIAYEQTKLEELQKEREEIEELVDVAQDTRNIFSKEFDDYGEIIAREEIVQNMKSLCKEYLQLQEEYDNETDETKKDEIYKKILETLRKIGDLENEYRGNHVRDAEFPTTHEEMKEKGISVIEKYEKELADKKQEIANKFIGKMNNLSDEDKNKIQKFCDTFEVDKYNLINNGIENAAEILSGKLKESYKQKFVNINKKRAVEDTIASLQKYDRAEALWFKARDAKDEEFLNEDLAKKRVNEILDRKLTESNLSLADPSHVKRRDLRKVLKNSVYIGMPFAGLLAFFSSFNKKKAMNKITDTYKIYASQEYINRVKSRLKKTFDAERSKREEFKKKYAEKGIEATLSDSTFDKNAAFEEIDKGER